MREREDEGGEGASSPSMREAMSRCTAGKTAPTPRRCGSSRPMRRRREVHATKDVNAFPPSELVVEVVGGLAKNAPMSHFRQTASMASDRA